MSTSKLGSLLKLCDLYGAKPSLLYDEAASFKTSAGAFSTILGVLCSAACTALVGYMYFSKTWNAVNVDTVYKLDPEGFTLSASTLPFGIVLSDAATLTPFMDPTIYELQVIYIHRKEYKVAGKSEFRIERTRINAVPCLETPLATKPLFADQPIQNIWCLEEFKTQTGKLHIRGQFTSDNYGALLIDIKRCTGPNCQDEATITAKLKKTQMAIFYSNSVLQASNYESPIMAYNTLFYTDVSPYFSKEITMWMTDNEIRTQSAITSYMPYQSRYVTVASDFVTNLQEVARDNYYPETLLRLVIQMDGKKLIINRAYQTLFEVLAVLGGVFKLFTFVCYCLCSLIAPTVLKLDLALKLSYSGHSMRTKSIGSCDSPVKQLAKETPKAKQIQPTSSPKSKRLPPSKQASIKSPVSQQSANANRFAKTIREQDACVIEEVKEEKAKKQDQTASQPSSNQEVQQTPRVVFSLQNNDPPSSSRKKLLPRKVQRAPDSDNTSSFHAKVRKIGFWSIFGYSFLPFLVPRSASIKKVIEHMDQVVMKKFDYMHLLRMMDDIQKLRLILLDAEDQASFEDMSVEQVASIHSKTKPQENYIHLIDLDSRLRTPVKKREV